MSIIILDILLSQQISAVIKRVGDDSSVFQQDREQAHRAHNTKCSSAKLSTSFSELRSPNNPEPKVIDYEMI